MSKEDKIIKDLKERNRSLNNQFRLRDIRVNILEQREIEKDKEIERLNNVINEALGIANERFNYYSHYKSNNEEHLEDWKNIFNVLLRRDN